MALVLLVIGALMSGAGIYAVIYGYSIIHVEEGWASVISGATLIAGGMVTIALGLVLRTLKQVKAGLLEAPARVTPKLDLSTPARGDGPDGPSVEPAATDTAPLATPLADPEIGASPAMGDPAFGPDGGEPDASRSFEAPAVPDRAAVRRGDKQGRQPAASTLPPLPPPAGEPAVEEPRPADDYKLETPSTAEHDLPPADTLESAPAVEALASPPMDDWLDRAFAELDRDNPPLPPRAAQKSSGASSGVAPAKSIFPPRPTPDLASKATPPAAGSDLAQDERVAPEPQKPRGAPPALETAGAEQHESAGQTSAAKEEPSTAKAAGTPQQASPSAQSAIIGRYESDGTTYVMFADGSIEAQSASGVYRFASMAELKAYIES